MLHKIIYKNFKSNIRKYILFFSSNIIAVAELFIFWGLNDVVVRAVTEPSIMMGIKSDFMIAVGLNNCCYNTFDGIFYALLY